MPDFNLLEGGIQDRFLKSRAKLQVFGGAYGNGKTTAAVVKSIMLGNEYHGFNALLARSTYPKLNDTLRKEFIKWCPKEAIASFPLSVNASNTCTWHNGSTFNFRYIQQQGPNEGTSNLLSATYDLIVIDQAEDPEITYKDFLDLFGRLRGNTAYKGEDETMPRTGPRWMFMLLNPTRNWAYQRVIKPYHDYVKHGIIGPDLLCERDMEDRPILDFDGKPKLLMDMVEGGTAENAHNLEPDFIKTLHSLYRGQMRDRFLLGKWVAYEGLVYPDFVDTTHMVNKLDIENYLAFLRKSGWRIRWIDGYDYGRAQPSCYLLGFVDPDGVVIIVDGFSKAEYELDDQFIHIKKIRQQWIDLDNDERPPIIRADPAIFRRTQVAKKGATTISDIFWKDGKLHVTPADNTIDSGIAKVSSYLAPKLFKINPFTGDSPSPHIFFNSELEFISLEFSDYMWQKEKDGKSLDKPVDKNDHAMDTIKYLLTTLPKASEIPPRTVPTLPAVLRWHTQDREDY